MATIAPGNRIVTLDLIRGVAVMGIFSVNVIAFAMIEAAYFNPAAYGGHHGIDLFVWAANMLLIDGKMRTLFSMLFGASMLLVIERAEASGQSGGLVHLRRMLVLLGFGLLHYYLVWFGDILTLYALSGLIAFLFRKLPVERLVALGMTLLLTHMAVLGSFAYASYQADVAAHAPGATQAAIDAWNQGFGNFLYPPAAEIAKDQALHLGPWVDFVRHNLRHWTSILPANLMWIPDTVGLMLLGMAGFRSGFLTGEWVNSSYRRVAMVTIPLGLAAAAVVIGYDIASHFYSVGLFTAFVVLETPFITAMAIGYAALIVLASRRTGWFGQRIAAAGRCAFTNYLGTSLIAIFVFHGWGLGLYGSLSRAQAWLLVPLVWAMMLAWSKPWLARFQYGPFEWAWRTLSRGKLQPMRRREPAAI